LGGLAIGARVALWQHNANPSYKLASIPRYDDILRTASWAGSARAAGRRPAGDGGTPKTARRIQAAGAAGPPPTGAFSTLLRQSGLRVSTGGVLATKSERKMSASTCLYSLYAWLPNSLPGVRGSSLCAQSYQISVASWDGLWRIIGLILQRIWMSMYRPTRWVAPWTLRHDSNSSFKTYVWAIALFYWSFSVVGYAL